MFLCHSSLRCRSSVTNVLLLVGFLYAMESIKVCADYTFSLEVGNLSIPSNQLGNGSCCEDTVIVDNCSSPCTNTMLSICLQGLEDNNCSLWERVVDLQAEADTYSLFTSSIVGSIWPMDTAVRLSLLIFKIDNSTSPGQQLDIDIFYINPNLTANQQQSSIMRYEGEIGVAMLSLSFMVSCTANYYGFDCGVYCNKSFGNYGCNETDGPIICVEGYRNETVNCTQCIPALGCSEVGGYCDLPGECRCFPGYIGTNCETGPTLDPSSVFASLSVTPPTSRYPLLITPTHTNSLTPSTFADSSSLPISPSETSTIPTVTSLTTKHTSTLLLSATSLTPTVTRPVTADHTVLTPTVSIFASTTLITPSMTATGQERDNSAVIAGAVIGVIIVLLLVVAGIALIVALLMRKTRARAAGGHDPLWYIKTNPTYGYANGREEKVSYLSEHDEELPPARMRTMTPDFLVVRRSNQYKTTVPSDGGNPALSYNMKSPVKNDPDELHRWFDEPETLLSADDATLPRNIRSPSADTDSTQAIGDASTAASTLSRPGKNLKVYQMPSFENDSIIFTNLEVESQVDGGGEDGEVTGEGRSKERELIIKEQLKINSKSL